MNPDLVIVIGAIAGGITGGIVAVILTLGLLRRERRLRGRESGLLFEEHAPSEWRAGSGALTRRYTRGGWLQSAMRRARPTTSGPFDYFNDRAKRVLALSQDEALRLNHNAIRTEHVLLGLTREGQGVAARALGALGVELSKLRAETEALVPRGETTVAPATISLAATTKKAFEYAREEAEKLGDAQIGTEHLLLGLLREDGTAMAVLRSLGARPEHIRQQVTATLGQLQAQVGGATATARPAAGGMGPFDRFDDRAKRVLALAQDEAIRLNHNYIGTEHVLLGLVREGEGLAARALETLGVPLDKVRTALEFIIGKGDTPTAPEHMTMSPRTKKVVELAIDESRRMGHTHVGTEHLLLGLIDEGEGIASGILESLGVTMPRARTTLIELLTAAGTPIPDDYTPTFHPRMARTSFDRFADRAKRVLALGQSEAMRMGHKHIGTEHLLLGLGRLTETKVADEAMSRIFSALNLTLDKLRAEVTKAVPAQERGLPPHEVTLSPRAKRVIELALEEAGPDKPVLPEHLLLAVGSEGEGIAAKILSDLGATPERVREVISGPKSPPES